MLLVFLLLENVVSLHMCGFITKFTQPGVLHLCFNFKRHLKTLTKSLEMGLLVENISRK